MRRSRAGAAFRVSDVAGLRSAADTIASELKHQYRLGWDPAAGARPLPSRGGHTTRKGVTVRTRSGYVPPS